ncbi:TPA: 30S ribosomal protein S8 [Patescibacteria group bacterium]|uniref:Small ribosomal subunit protein uS8 n=1 Tax=candidate division Kazan bacterium GW2011_GWA1_44_22 TaxID=1620410 RepID=A0A0G1K9P3_UNCK3|nr:MAG: 30S ribosomal protein S8 [candidate division Kazan bacterium GW2011_GWA1_44_22]HAR55033.1 30S ribosomal protein S8 [Patescibacteria group bacterium]HCR41907.1 30S ribosomal protein S8 [Patescibacteria group bacterium]
MNTHPIADMLTRIRNASARRFSTTKVPASRFKEALAKMLVDQGWLEGFEIIKPTEGHPYLLLTLKYHRQTPIIRGIKMISTPGQRIYMNKAKLHKYISSKLETLVISTSQGLITAEEAKTMGLGGEVIFKIW